MDLSEDFKYIINRALGLTHPNAEAAKECMGALSALKQWDAQYGDQSCFADRRFKERAQNLAMAMVDTGIGASMARFHLHAKPKQEALNQKTTNDIKTLAERSGFLSVVTTPTSRLPDFTPAYKEAFQRAPDLKWMVIAANRSTNPAEALERIVSAWMFETTQDMMNGVEGTALRRADVVGELNGLGLCKNVYMKYISQPTPRLSSNRPSYSRGMLDPQEDTTEMEKVLVINRSWKQRKEGEAPFDMQLKDLSKKLESWDDVTRDFDIAMDPMDMPNAMMYRSMPYVPPQDVPPIHEDRTGEAVAKFGNWYDQARQATVELKPLVSHSDGRELQADGVPRIVEVIRDEDGNVIGKIETPLEASLPVDNFNVEINGQRVGINEVRLKGGDVLSISIVPPEEVSVTYNQPKPKSE
jgi:hypothetical protein